jgi:hypothetical protein
MWQKGKCDIYQHSPFAHVMSWKVTADMDFVQVCVTRPSMEDMDEGVVRTFGQGAAECKIQRPFQANLTLQT